MTTTAAGEPVPGSLWGELLDVASRHERAPTWDTHRHLIALSQTIADQPGSWSVIMALAVRAAQLETIVPDPTVRRE